MLRTWEPEEKEGMDHYQLQIDSKVERPGTGSDCSQAGGPAHSFLAPWP